MASLNGQQINNTYTGLLKTTDNAGLTGTLKNIESGDGIASPLSMANNYFQVQTETIEFVESTGGTNLMMISPTNVYFEGAVDFTNATVTGIGGGAPGLVNGTGVGSSLASLKVADYLVNTPATSTSGGNIAIGDNARAEGGDTFGRGNVAIGANARSNNERGVALGMGSEALGSRGVGIGENARGNSTRSVAVGQATSSQAFLSVAVGNYSNANHEGAICIGGYASNSNGNYSIQIGREVNATTNGIAIGLQASSTATGAVALGAGMTAAWANATTVNQLQLANYSNLNYADDTAAAAGGVPLGGIYHTSGALKIRIV